MSNLAILPVALPMASAIALLFARDSLRASRVLSVTSNLVVLGLSLLLVETVRTDGIQVLAFGGWPAPFGIVFAVDMLGALMVAVTMVVSTACLAFAMGTLDRERQRMFFHPLFQILLMGVNGSFLTGDIFNLFVWFEVLLVASYGLMALGSAPYQLQETFKYLVVNATASAMFLIAVALIYSLTGTLNMADLAVKFPNAGTEGLRSVIAVVFLVVFGTKGALFPVYMWLPRAYYAPPTVISGLFGGLLTKVGVYALFRVTALMFHQLPWVLPLLLFVAGATMLFGVLGALSQWDMKRVLSYHIISQIGYMIMGLGLFTPLALAGGIFYIIHHILVKTALFLVAGSVEKNYGTTSLRRLGGVLDTDPVLGALFFVAALGLAGIPPLSGFVAKLVLTAGGLQQHSYGIVAVSVLVSFLTLFSMMKIFRYAFWRPQELERLTVHGAKARLSAITALVGAGVVLGLGGGLAMPYAQLAADQLLDVDGYVRAVLVVAGDPS